MLKSIFRVPRGSRTSFVVGAGLLAAYHLTEAEKNECCGIVGYLGNQQQAGKVCI